MSEPLRFKPVNPAHEMVYSADGGWVSWEDYARLKAAFDLLDESIKLGPSTIPVSRGYYFWKESEQYFLKDENTRLKAEVERLKEDNRQLTKAFEIAEGIIKRMGKAAEDAAKEVQS